MIQCLVMLHDVVSLWNYLVEGGYEVRRLCSQGQYKQERGITCSRKINVRSCNAQYPAVGRHAICHCFVKNTGILKHDLSQIRNIYNDIVVRFESNILLPHNLDKPFQIFRSQLRRYGLIPTATLLFKRLSSV